MPRQKIPIIFFTLLITGFVVFHFLFFVAFMHLNKGSARNKALSLANKNICLLKLKKTDLYLNKNGFEWKDENKEVVILGHYFEVVKIVENGAMVTAYLVADAEETGLAHQYFKLSKKHRKGLSETTGFLLSLVYLNTCPIDYPEPESLAVKNHFVYNRHGGFEYKRPDIKPPTIFFWS